MIIHKDSKAIEKRTGFPNENFGNYSNVFVLDDESEIAKKIERNAPFFDVVLDTDGNLTDITPTERPQEPKQPTEAERIRSLEDTVNFLLGL